MSKDTGIVFLQPNKVDYLLPGGEKINRFLGEDGNAKQSSQLWVASLVTSSLEPGSQTGLSRLKNGELLRDWLAQAPEERLGLKHWETYGMSLGFLLKLLNSSTRLLIQTHPNDEQAKQYFNLPCGKAEAWYVLEADSDARIWLGFKPGVTPEYFRSLIDEQNSSAMLNCLHEIPLHAGDVFFIPPGTVHALGSGSLVAEIQQPSDITLRAEYIRPDGSRLAPESMHSGAGMEALMDCFRFDCLSREEMLARYSAAPTADGKLRCLIGPQQTNQFSMSEVRLSAGESLAREKTAFRVVLVCEGSAHLQWGGGNMLIHQGDELFIPACLSEYRYNAVDELRILECDPPLN